MHTLLFFMSLRPVNFSPSRLRKRLRDYSASVRRTEKLLAGRDWNIIYCENTISKGETEKFLSVNGVAGDMRLSTVSENLGISNKGIGELDMLSNGLQDYRGLIEESKTISYFSGRRIMANHYLIERTEALSSSALVSNPDFFGMDGSTIASSEEQGLYNDMFFSMKTSILKKYLEYYRDQKEHALADKIGSEQLLYQFINSNGIDFEFLDSLGLLRREERRLLFFPVFRQRWHII
jgi:hypothetical protein